jgi:hypothetical protein
MLKNVAFPFARLDSCHKGEFNVSFEKIGPFSRIFDFWQHRGIAVAESKYTRTDASPAAYGNFFGTDTDPYGRPYEIPYGCP